MRQIAQYQDGRLELQEVPEPLPPPGGVLVRLTHSVISVGTEKMKVEQASMNLLQKARARPDQVMKVLDTARTLGWRAAMQKVKNRLEVPTPLGYSAAGIVEAVDAGEMRLRVGDRIAIGGAECAYHAELAAVPGMLAVKVPDGVENWQAAYTTVVSIALQAVRRLEPQLGDRVLVIGQGLVGLLVTALLRAGGVRVMAMDVAPARRQFATAMGAEEVVITTEENLRERVRGWTEGYGADGVVLAASSGSNDPTERALESLRDRGRVVVVGKTKVDLQWTHAYGKEIDLRFSRSYGPGRYDSSYEWAGVDYPIGYVRWTEQRNFEACLELMRRGALDLGALTTRRIPFAHAVEAYRDLMTERAAREVGIILEYEPRSEPQRIAAAHASSGVAHLPDEAARAAAARLTAPATRLTKPAGRLDVIGAGNFARTMLLPHLAGRVPLGTVVNHTALSANHVMGKFGFAEAGTDPAAALAGEPGSAVLIATRHNMHARLVTGALAAHRHVFVEKPLCLTRAELEEIEQALAASRGSLQVGFNRRFAGAAVALKSALARAPGPKTASFQVMAGPLDPAHWFADYAESGGRVLGEACHFLDFFCFLFDSEPVRVEAQPLGPVRGRTPFPDSVAAQVEFADGSCGQLIYSAQGDSSWPKEICTVFAPGLVAQIENFRKLVIHQGRRRTVRHFAGKGHEEEMRAWTSFLRAEGPHPQPFEDIRRSTLLTFAVLDAIRERHGIDPRELSPGHGAAAVSSDRAA